MPIAKPRLFDEMTVQQLVEELASEWGDDEKHVLELLADLLVADRRQHGDDGIDFYYRHRLDEENENGSVNYHPLKIPFGDKSYIIHALRETAANDEWGMEDKRFYVVADEYKLKNLSREQKVFGQLNTLPETFNIKVSLRDIFVNKFDIKSLLSDNNLPVPQGVLTEEVGQGEHRPPSVDTLELKEEAERKCYSWLVEIGQEQESNSSNTKGRLSNEAKQRFGISQRAFENLWRVAMPPKFKAPGARKSGH